MKPFTVMLAAGESSGDRLAAELVDSLRSALLLNLSTISPDLQPRHTPIAPRFFGVGGPHMAAAGVELHHDATTHSVFGLSEIVRHLRTFHQLFRHLLNLASQRQPDLIVLIDNSGFNRRLAAAIQRRVRSRRRSFNNWRPRIVYYVSPQVWASRPGRAYQLARDVHLLLSIFPFEPDWYANRIPQFPVEFVGHPLIDRYAHTPRTSESSSTIPLVLLLPGSRTQEIRRHLPPMIDALQTITLKRAVRARMILPNDSLVTLARHYTSAVPNLEIRPGGLAESLSEATIAIASSGTVTLECAFFGVPTVVLYRVSWPTYFIARQVVKVDHIAMPNILSHATVYPEFIQGDVTAENIAREAIDLLMNTERRASIQLSLQQAIQTLGPPGASHRAAHAILKLLASSPPDYRASFGS
jgi:lipid-A-disaccharide synthase